MEVLSLRLLTADFQTHLCPSTWSSASSLWDKLWQESWCVVCKASENIALVLADNNFHLIGLACNTSVPVIKVSCFLVKVFQCCVFKNDCWMLFFIMILFATCDSGVTRKYSVKVRSSLSLGFTFYSPRCNAFVSEVWIQCGKDWLGLICSLGVFR